MTTPTNNTTSKSYATATQYLTFPTKDQAVVLDSIENIQIKDYAQALDILPNFKRPHPPTESTSDQPHTTDDATEERTAESPRLQRCGTASSVIFDENDDIDTSQSSSGATYEKRNGPKKQRRSPIIDIHSSSWHAIEEHIRNSQKNYPLTPQELQTYLESTFGITNIKDITLQFTENTHTLIDMFKDILPMISDRKFKKIG
ncbi:hypothetical protein ACJJTC_014653 [Scirpophaga incertulas]